MKNYTDIKQSKKLAEILQPESADMCWGISDETLKWKTLPYLMPWRDYTAKEHYLPCWSLAALLDQLEDVICDEEDNQWELVIKKEGVQYDIYYLTVYGEQENIEIDRFYDDLIDCCYEMVIKLKEKDLI